MGTSTFTFYVNYNHFIQRSAGIWTLPVFGAYSQCGKFRKGIVSLEVILFPSEIFLWFSEEKEFSVISTGLLIILLKIIA